MRVFVFFLISITIFSGSAYLASQKMGIDFGFDKSLSSSEWAQALPGKWEFKNIIKEPRGLWVFEGEVEYLKDGHFERFVTVKYYANEYSEPEIADQFLRIVAGGTVSGTFLVDSLAGNWLEKIDKSSIFQSYADVGFEENFDSWIFFEKGSNNRLGNLRNDEVKSEVEKFTKQEIKIKGTSFSEGGTLSWTFKRIK